MARWKYTLDISDVFHDDGMPLPEKGAVIVARIRELPVYKAQAAEGEEIVNTVEELEDAVKADDEDWFNGAWSYFYDWADAERVWVDTFGRAGK